jgi:ABC-2 type transport system permease protein
LIFRRELKSNAKGLVVWSLVLGGLVLMMMSVYPSFAEDARMAEEMLDVFPEPIARVFGMDTLNLGSYTGFYGVEAHLINTLVGSVYAALLAGGMLAKEENDRTAEFLLSKPVTRTAVTLQKLAAVLFNLFILNLVIAIVSFACTGFADEAVETDILAWYLIATFLLHATVASVSFLLSAVMRRTRSIASLALGIVFLSYALHVAAGLSDRFDVLRRVSLFSFTDAAAIAKHGGLAMPDAAAMALISLLCIAGAIGYYRNKDIAG